MSITSTEATAATVPGAAAEGAPVLPMHPHSRLPDLIVGFGVTALGLLALWQATIIPSTPIPAPVGPHAVPYFVGAIMTLLGLGLTATAWRGGWSHTIEDAQHGARTNWRALGLFGLGMVLNLALIQPLGFSIAASAQFVLIAAAFGSRRPLRDVVVALIITLLAWVIFVKLLGVNIGAGLLERWISQLFGWEVT